MAIISMCDHCKQFTGASQGQGSTVLAMETTGKKLDFKVECAAIENSGTVPL